MDLIAPFLKSVRNEPRFSTRTVLANAHIEREIGMSYGDAMSGIVSWAGAIRSVSDPKAGSLKSTKLAVAGLLSLFVCAQASAEDYPDRPIKLVVPYAAGGSTDGFARLVGDELGKALGKPIVIENRGGGGTITGSLFVANSKPDGYTVLLAATNLVNLFLLGADKIPFKMSDFVTIGSVASAPLLFAINPQLPVKTVGDFVAYAKANPSKAACATYGPGSTTHLACELINQQLGISLKNVPYKGAGPAWNDLVGGHIEVLTGAVPTAIPLYEAGQIRILGVMSEERVASAKSIPTLKELGHPKLLAATTFGLLAPANTPPAVVQKLSNELAKIVRQPDVVAKIEKLGAIPVASTSQEFDALLKREAGQWATVAKDLNLTGLPLPQ